MPYAVYKVIHLVGILMIFLSFGGILQHAISGGTKASNVWRKQAAMTHGFGLVLALLGGFGLLARLGIHWPWPGWIFVKLLIWLLLGGLTGVIVRKPESSKTLWGIVILCGLVAAYMANFKPF